VAALTGLLRALPDMRVGPVCGGATTVEAVAYLVEAPGQGVLDECGRGLAWLASGVARLAEQLVE